ncbi:cation:proton antiporter [Alphaproteobacteria bacterium]|nr:cation:proton antiporter [Alphaproteobacteria bacterium]
MMQSDFFIQIAFLPFCALLCGILFERLKQPAVLGYILAGVLLGPFVLDWGHDREAIKNLAELGVQMLLFLVGMELSLQDFKKVWPVALMCTGLQIVASFGAVYALGIFFDMPSGLKVILAFSLALSSTAVAIKILENIGELHTDVGRMTVGILIAQDLALLPILLFIGNMETPNYGLLLIKLMIALTLLVGVIFYFSKRTKPRLNLVKYIGRIPEFRPIAALVFCFGTATLGGIIGLSPAYGAFLGGLIVGNTADKNDMVEATKPLQAVLLMAFFLSIGLLMDVSFILAHLGKVLILLTFMTLIKTGINLSILHVLNQPWSKAFLSGVVLAQMGEFSFVLATAGLNTQSIDTDGSKLIISLAALSLAISPLWMGTARKLHNLAPNSAKTIRELFTFLYGQRFQQMADFTQWTKKQAETVKKKAAQKVTDTKKETMSPSDDDKRIPPSMD